MSKVFDPDRDPVAEVRSALIFRRLAMGLDQAALGVRLGVTQAAISIKERGVNPNVSVLAMESWANALGGHIVISVEWVEEVEKAAMEIWYAINPPIEGEETLEWAYLSTETRERYMQAARAALGRKVTE